MIKLDKLNNGGAPFVFFYDVSGNLYDYGSIESINTDSASPPSLLFPTTAIVNSGLFDHSTILIKTASQFTNIDLFNLATGDANYQDAVQSIVDNIVNSVTVTKIYFVLTDIEYQLIDVIALNSYIHIGLDVYVAI